MRCTICKLPMSEISDCLEAIGICNDCRLSPNNLMLARKRMNAHLTEHRNAGDFLGFTWRDPQRWLTPPPMLTLAKREKYRPIDPLKSLGCKWPGTLGVRT